MVLDHCTLVIFNGGVLRMCPRQALSRHMDDAAVSANHEIAWRHDQ
jgi:hypothetical protein